VRVDIVTIFPGYLAPLDLSLIGKARHAGVLEVVVHDLRDFTSDRHRTVDDAPFGGGAGMVMRPEPWGEALDHVLAVGRERLADTQARPTLVVPTPAGHLLTQPLVRRLAAEPWLAFACGRYEGIDERVLDDAAEAMPVLPLSLGDYVLAGGEVAVLAVVEAVGRLLPGVLGNAGSLVEESHEGGLLEYPVHTRPASWHDREVPAVLLSGHHAQVERWRRDERLRRTARRRPDLLERLDVAGLDPADAAVLAAEGWSVATDEAGRRFLARIPPVAH
jgi:tRNA (guanine37-N1)-methyltransferase